MTLDVLGLALSLAVGQPGALTPLLSGGVTFDARQRAVSDWRAEAAFNLDASPGTRAALLLGRDPVAVTRCVRLNNYWCIKRGGWGGEIAADRDGHVAFVSAAEGATVAALLLRRYYVDYGRHSAFAIVSRWAPATCGGATPTRRHGGAQGGLATRVFGGTLRGRWLAAHGHRIAGRGRVSAVPDRLIGATLPAPTIALGLGIAPAGLAAGLADLSTGGSGPAPPLGPACAGDGIRIAAYAAKAAAGIAGSTDADLGLFDAAGQPTPRLARLMRNMAGVEIGPLGAGDDLVTAAVAHAAAIIAARRPVATGAAPAPRLDEASRRAPPDPARSAPAWPTARGP